MENLVTPECPSACPEECDNDYRTRKCIYIGKEPKEGMEGLSVITNPVNEDPEPYKVVSSDQVADF